MSWERDTLDGARVIVIGGEYDGRIGVVETVGMRWDQQRSDYVTVKVRHIFFSDGTDIPLDSVYVELADSVEDLLDEQFNAE